ncbi:MAG TPA: hypothetical protein VIZ28_00145, partial [Chitinophagaceae bacterium]
SAKGAAVIFIFITYISLDTWLAALAVLLVGVLYLIAIRPLIVHVNPETITYTSFPKKNISWNELSNVILKDGWLTVDFKNNKILQSEIIDEQNPVNEKEFNEFCQTQLKSAV